MTNDVRLVNSRGDQLADREHYFYGSFSRIGFKSALQMDMIEYQEDLGLRERTYPSPGHLTARSIPDEIRFLELISKTKPSGYETAYGV